MFQLSRHNQGTNLKLFPTILQLLASINYFFQLLLLSREIFYLNLDGRTQVCGNEKNGLVYRDKSKLVGCLRKMDYKDFDATTESKRMLFFLTYVTDPHATLLQEIRQVVTERNECQGRDKSLL